MLNVDMLKYVYNNICNGELILWVWLMKGEYWFQVVLGKMLEGAVSSLQEQWVASVGMRLRHWFHQEAYLAKQKFLSARISWGSRGKYPLNVPVIVVIAVIVWLRCSEICFCHAICPRRRSRAFSRTSSTSVRRSSTANNSVSSARALSVLCTLSWSRESQTE